MMFRVSLLVAALAAMVSTTVAFGPSLGECIIVTLRWYLVPMTDGSVTDGARFMVSVVLGMFYWYVYATYYGSANTSLFQLSDATLSHPRLPLPPRLVLLAARPNFRWQPPST